jgi:ornithine cyclodeaminase
VKVLSEEDVRNALDPDALVDALAEALAKQASSPPRTTVEVPGQGAVLLMGVHVHGRPTITAKLVSLFPHNRSEPTHQAVIVVFDAATGTPQALMDGTLITELRTAAATRLATRRLAPPNARVLAILGTGVQAQAHLDTLTRDRDWYEIRIAGRDRAKAAALAGDRASATTDFRAAVEGADVVCATTAATEPVVHRDWLKPEAHVNSVGYPGPELDAATVEDAFVVVESRAAAAQSADLRGKPPDAELAEIRDRPKGLTVYKSVGIAAEDDAAAALVLETALKPS